MNLILVGHYESERPAVEWMASEIESQISGLQVMVSQQDLNPLQLFS